MNDETPTGAPLPEDHAAGVDVEGLPTVLTFVAGELEVPLGELQTHGPGFVYDLEGRLGGQVEIRANGRTIGSGELVELEGRIGVRILECR